MKTLLINPNRFYPARETHYAIGLPLGLLYLAASLEKSHFPVKVFDLLISPTTRLHRQDDITILGIEDEEIVEELRRERPDVIGITCQYTAQWDSAARLIPLCRATCPRAWIVLGGPHATVEGEKILAQHAAVDFILAGEGELSLPRLIGLLDGAGEADAAFDTVPGLLWRSKDGAIHRNKAAVILDLDQLPLPAYHQIDLEHLFHLNEQGLSTRSQQRRAIPLITSRGCPYTCSFCSIHLSMGYRWRPHSVKYTIDHIRHLVERYGIKHLYIEDDNFTFSHDRANAICRQMIAERLPVTWDTPNGVRADTLDAELIENAKTSGCVSLVVAAESGDQEIVSKVIKKKIDLKSIENAAALCKQAKLTLSCFFVIGFPQETKRNVFNTFRFAFRLLWKYDCNPHFSVATPLPGTELERVVIENGLTAKELRPMNLSGATSVWHDGLIRNRHYGVRYLYRCHLAFYYLTRVRDVLVRLHDRLWRWRHPRLKPAA